MSFAKEKLEKKFKEEYEKLNAQQQKAVDTIDGPVMVIAGPGTGKTQILASRIGKILLETDALPENILCLTYTDAGVVAMRKRLLQFIGPDGWIFVTRGAIKASNEELLQKPLPEDAVKLYKSNNHMGNFFDCVAARRQPRSGRLRGPAPLRRQPQAQAARGLRRRGPHLHRRAARPSGGSGRDRPPVRPLPRPAAGRSRSRAGLAHPPVLPRPGAPGRGGGVG